MPTLGKGKKQFVQKVLKCFEKLWLLHKTRVLYYLGALKCILIDFNYKYVLEKNTTVKFADVPVCLSSICAWSTDLKMN